MKNRISGAVVLLAVLGGFSATPALAEWIRVALVKNVDERGRAPYMHFQASSCPGGGATECQVVFPPVPAGKRLVLERVNASVNFATNGVRVTGLLAPQDVLFVLPARSMSDPSVLIVNESTLAYFESGQSPIFHLVVNNSVDVPFVTAVVSGYLVNLEP